MRWIIIVASVLLACATPAAEDQQANALERLERLVDKVEVELKAATGVASPDASSQAEESPLWQDIEWDIVEMRHLAKRVQRQATGGGAANGKLARGVKAFCDAYNERRGANLAEPLNQIRVQLKQLKPKPPAAAPQPQMAAKGQGEQPRKGGDATLDDLERLFNQVASKARARVKGKKQKPADVLNANSFYYTWEQMRAMEPNLEKAKTLQSQKQEAAQEEEELAELAFKRDLLQLWHLAELIQGRALSQGARNINLTRCVKAICDACDVKRMRALGGKFSLNAALAQMRQQLKRLGELEADLGLPDQDDSDRKDLGPWRTGGALEELDDQALADKLWDKRRRILKADSSASGLKPATVAAYLATLTSAQEARFESLRRKYSNAGFPDADAEATAVLELHGQLKKDPDNYNRGEVEAIFKRLGDW